MLTQAHLYVIGDVIKVGFRAWARIQIHAYNLTGWIRNVYHKPEIFGPHGGVEMVLQGKEQDIQGAIEAIRQGSPFSRIDDIEIKHEDPTETFQEFTVLKSESFNHRG